MCKKEGTMRKTQYLAFNAGEKQLYNTYQGYSI